MDKIETIYLVRQNDGIISAHLNSDAAHKRQVAERERWLRVNPDRQGTIGDNFYVHPVRVEL